jgi:hypothetical protein
MFRFELSHWFKGARKTLVKLDYELKRVTSSTNVMDIRQKTLVRHDYELKCITPSLNVIGVVIDDSCNDGLFIENMI